VHDMTEIGTLDNVDRDGREFSKLNYARMDWFDGWWLVAELRTVVVVGV